MSKYTYCTGPSFSVTKEIYRSTLGQIIKDLEESFGSGYGFDLDRVCEGGIKLTTWPGKDPEDKSSYKTIRFTDRWDRVAKWPSIEEEVTLRDWKIGLSEGLIFSQLQSESPWSAKKKPKKFVLQTFLKAFYGAPCWTMEELNILSSVFYRNGLVLYRSRNGNISMPLRLKKRLVEHGGELGMSH